MAKKKSNSIQFTTLPLLGQKASVPLDPQRMGMPAMDSIHDDTRVIRRKGKPPIRILRTTETEPYEKTKSARAFRAALHEQKEPKAVAVRAAAKASAPPPDDNYAGTDRKAAKLSVAPGGATKFADVKALIATLPSVADMIKLKIPIGASSGRVAQEERFVHVEGFLYAASREADNDFHLIVGLDPNATDEMYMTMEVSGLPPANLPSFPALNAARKSFKDFFGKNLPEPGYHFYHPVIPVEVTGSLFFDATHEKGQAPGPASLKSRMPTIWEVHPVSSIKLG